MTLVYKLLTRADWDAAKAKGVFDGAPVDLADGFIHFSTAAQAGETARRYFAGVEQLLAVSFDADALGEGLKWEASRGGDLFPHLYSPLPTALAVSVQAIELEADGTPIVGELAE